MKTLLLTLLLASSALAADSPIAAAPSRWAKLDDAKIHYKTIGRGRTVIVFVHGWGGDMNVWREQVRHFEPKARMIVLDLPGHGRSDKPELTYSMKYFARGVRAVMDHAKVDRAILVGHSMGTPIIREFDRIYPSRVRGLVAVDGALSPIFPPEMAKAMVDMLKGPNFPQTLERSLAGMTMNTRPELAEEVKRVASALPQHALVSAFEGMMDPAIWKDDAIPVPVLVLNAKMPHWSEDYEKRVRAMVRDLDYNLIEGTSHWVMLDKPAEVNRAMERWMVGEKWLK